MAVSADDLALVHLIEKLTPIPVWQTLGDVECLVLDVVELEDDRIGFAAVDAGVRCKELEKNSVRSSRRTSF